MCDCQSYNGQGVFSGSVPEKVLPYRQYFPDQPRETVSVDACIADTIEALWAAGVKTGACCCGHGGQSPIANGRPNVMITDPSQAPLAFEVLAKDAREWWVQFWAGGPVAESMEATE